MLSRVANNLIWMNRYMARGNGILGLLRINFYANQDSPELFSWTPIIKNFASSDVEFQTEDALECIDYMIFDVSNDNSIVNIITRARENARSVQEHISRESWLSINNYYLYLTNNDLRKKLKEQDPVRLLEELLNHHLIYYGTHDITQERGPAYYFMNVGRYLERVILISDFTTLKLKEISEATDALEKGLYWRNLLLVIGGYQQYLKTYKSTFNEDHIVDLIFKDKYFPRSVYYCIHKLNAHITALIENGELEKNNLQFLLGKLESTIKYTTIENIKTLGLNNFIEGIKQDIRDISANINSVYYNQTN
ncbi:alpha-E domain-containing protein [Aestuariibaculum sediminum]|uniref:Alpha-E domain-containing protein n=1 Tax=Aestuariibaculum sediminum TaxID=2770637 RepID=A0A8J6Q050_9FLAO|nr:alpha-E domain-containing protein [Aestuariibaculum sediminum]MBD0832868.1 alpha-E domain-containing protein [Aestuariibaculum sediminum]